MFRCLAAFLVQPLLKWVHKTFHSTQKNRAPDVGSLRGHFHFSGRQTRLCMSILLLRVSWNTGWSAHYTVDSLRNELKGSKNWFVLQDVPPKKTWASQVCPNIWKQWTKWRCSERIIANGTNMALCLKWAKNWWHETSSCYHIWNATCFLFSPSVLSHCIPQRLLFACFFFCSCFAYCSESFEGAQQGSPAYAS